MRILSYSRHRLAIFVTSGFSAFELGAALEVFAAGSSANSGRQYEIMVCGVAEGPVPAVAGLEVRADDAHLRFEDADTILVLNWPVEAEAPASLTGALSAAARRGARVLASSSGVFLLAAAGLLDQRAATTHWALTTKFAETLARSVEEQPVLYVEAGNLITAGGFSATLDMLLHVVRSDHGSAAANEIARRLLVSAHRDGGQTQLIDQPVAPGPDMRLNQVIEYLRHNVGRQHRTSDLASMAAMSVRSFFRKFRQSAGLSPYDWLVRERISLAKRLLEETTMSIDQVAEASGFGGTETLRHHFRKSVGRTPSEYRTGVLSNQPGGPSLRRSQPSPWPGSSTPLRVASSDVCGRA